MSAQALINEGARILEGALARSATDIDVIWCNGYGFPRWRGGPMFYADTLGLVRVVGSIEKYRDQESTRLGAAAPLLRTIAREGRRIGDWSRTETAG